MKTWTFTDIMKHGSFTASLVIACIKDTGLRGTLSHGERTWSSDEAKKIIDLCISTLDGSRYA